jgi:xylulokinase
MYLGFDSSTQSLSGMIIDPVSGEIVLEKSVNFGNDLPHYGAPSGFIPNGTAGEVHSDPRMWLEALDEVLKRLSAEIDLSCVKAIGGSGQQHGSVYLDETFEDRIRNANVADHLASILAPSFSRKTSPIWMDTSTGQQCREMADAVGGNEEVCRITGSVAIERFTGSQIRKFYQVDPAGYANTAKIHLVSSFMCSVLSASHAPIDFGDGAGMNLMNLAQCAWDAKMLEATAPQLIKKLPSLAASGSSCGLVGAYFVKKYGFSPSCKVGVFTGDNPASLVGMGATAAGQVVISLGTSDTFFAGMNAAHTDPRGFGHVFGNPGGGYMCLVCFRNGSLAREALRDELSTDWNAFDTGGLSQTQPGNEGNMMLPFYGPEITPRRDFSGPIRQGSEDFEVGHNAAAQIRALLEGQFLNMRLHTDWIGIAPEKIRLTGGASRSNGIAQVVADVFHAPVERLSIANSAALGAALLATTTDGYDLLALQKVFCQPSQDAMILPAPGVNYDVPLKQFAVLLGN